MDKKNMFIVVAVLLAIFVVVGANVVPMFTLSNSDNVVKIGIIIPLTGSEARQGDLIKKGVLLAQDELKKSNKNVEFVFEDSKNNPGDGINSYNYIKEDNSIDVIYTLGSPVSIALSKSVPADDKILFAVAASPAYKTDGNYIFRLQPSSIEEGIKLSKLAYTDLNIKRVAVIYVNNDYGKGVEKFFIDPYIKLGGTVVYEDSFSQDNIDYRLILSKAKQSKPDAIYIGALGVQVAEFAKQAKELGINNVKFICGQACQNPDLLDVGGDSVEGYIYGSVYLNPETEFYKDYVAKYNEAPAQISEEYYKLTKLYSGIHDVCKRDKECAGEKLKDNEFTKKYGVTFYMNGEINDPFVIYTVKDGKFVLYK